MPGFFVISGYFGRKDSPSDRLKVSLLKKCQTYLLPLFSWYLIIETLILGENKHNIIIALNSFVNRVDGTLWFLWVLFVLSVIYTGLNYILRKKRVSDYIKGIVYLGVIYVFLLVIGIIFGINILGIKYILYYTLFYVLGYFVKLAQEYSIQPWKNDRVMNASFMISLIAFGAIVFNFDVYNCDDNLAGISMRFAAAIFGIFLLLYIVKIHQKTLEKTHLATIGKYTLEIYATHVLFNSLMSVDNIYQFNSIYGFLNFLIGGVLCVFFTITIIVIIKSNPISDFIFYGKKK